MKPIILTNAVNLPERLFRFVAFAAITLSGYGLSGIDVAFASAVM